jgi:hypothetical protein
MFNVDKLKLLIILVCHKNSIWYCHWATSVRGATENWEQVFGEQLKMGSKCSGSKCLWGASVWGASVIGEQVSLGSNCHGSKCLGSNCRWGASVRGATVAGATV